MPVVLGPGWPGVLLHEAVGHGLKGDFNRKGTSAFSNRIGELVASPLCTVVDDGTIKDRRGSLSVDDEGVPAQNTTLIENGVLKGYMQDKMNARLMGTQSTSNGRRESFAHLPMPRMTNTYMLPGESEPEEIIASVDKGLYAVNFGGGQVDITSGRFVFSLSEAYLIENGKISAPVKGATLIGSGRRSWVKFPWSVTICNWTRASASAARKARRCRWESGNPVSRSTKLPWAVPTSPQGERVESPSKFALRGLVNRHRGNFHALVTALQG